MDENANSKKYYLYEMKISSLNMISLLLMVVVIFLTVLLYRGLRYDATTWNITMLLLIPYFLLHELVHSLGYVLHGASFQNIVYGAHLEKGILCCLCKQNITRKNILISVIYPFLFLGIFTYIIGILINNSVLIWLSIFNISGCSGDLIMFLAFLKLKDFEYSEYDNPTAFGLYSATDLRNKKLFGLQYIGCEENLERNDLKKITISKTSIIVFLLFMAFVVFNLLIK